MKIDITDEKVRYQMGFPFWEWAICGQFTIAEEDLKYIQVIKTHPCFPIISEGNQIMEPRLSWANIRINQIVFYEHFYKDPNCPRGIKNILFGIIGLEKGNLAENNMLDLLNFRYHSVEL